MASSKQLVGFWHQPRKTKVDIFSGDKKHKLNLFFGEKQHTFASIKMSSSVSANRVSLYRQKRHLKWKPGSMQDLIIEAREPEVLVDYIPLKDTNTIASTSLLTVSISLILSNRIESFDFTLVERNVF